MQLLAILGRGIRKRGTHWVPSDDLIMHGIHDEHIAIEQPVDDENPHCFIGGAELNVRAGAILYVNYRDEIRAIVCAYGGRSSYLVEVDAPSECEIMSARLKQLVPESEHPAITLWPREQQAQSGKTNTWQELHNIFALAVERGFVNVGIVTVCVHYARTVLMAQHHLINPHFTHLKIQCYVSEDVLLRHDEEHFGPRIRAMHGSKTFMRTLFFEQRGINCFLAGNY